VVAQETDEDGDVREKAGTAAGVKDVIAVMVRIW
jgi:hypothetical protein